MLTEPRVHGLCACGQSTITAVLDGQRVTVERPPAPDGRLHLRLDLTPITAVDRGPTIDLTDPFDDGTRWHPHTCEATR